MSKKKVNVTGYTRKDGTYVRSHTRNVESSSKHQTSSSSFNWLSSSRSTPSAKFEIPNYSPPKPSAKDILIKKYKLEISRVDDLIKNCDSLIAQGKTYVENPTKHQKEVEKSERKAYLLLGSLSLLLLLILSMNFIPQFFQRKSSPMLPNSGAPSQTTP